MTEVMHHKSDETSQVCFTDAAVKHIVKYLEKASGASGVRLSVKKTGCSGYSYQIDYVDKPVNDDLNEPLIDEYHVYIERKSLPLLKGVNVDYVKDGLNYKFMFKNPNQTGQCGCGESFTVE